MTIRDQILHILLIEDSSDDAALTARLLKRHGFIFSIVRIQTREELINALREKSWDVILSDYRLPGFSGPEALDLVQQASSQTPFIVVSGALGEEKAVELIKRGADDYLLKDRLSRLGVAIEQAIYQRRLQSEQRLNKAKLQAIFDHAQDIFAVVNPESGLIIEANQAITTRLNCTLDQIIGRHWSSLWTPPEGLTSSLFLLNPEDLPRKYLAETISTADGKTLLMDVQVSAIPWVNGSACLLTFHDVTERERKVSIERDAHQLKLALQKEREINWFRSEIISTLSHEFRTPLTSIQISSDLLTSYYDRLPIDKRQRYAENLKTQSDYLLRLLDEVVLAGMGDMKFTPDQMERIHPADILAPRVEALQKKYGDQYTIEFETVGTHLVYEICVDPLLKIFNQLVENSVKFSPGGGLIGIQLSCQSDGFKFGVRDYGIGISEEDQDQLFKPFFRGQNVENVRGIGLGLFNSRRILEHLGGSLDFTSVLGEGSTFEVTIPAHGFIQAVSRSANLSF